MSQKRKNELESNVRAPVSDAKGTPRNVSNGSLLVKQAEDE